MPDAPRSDLTATGHKTRRRVLGDAHVNRAEAAQTTFDAPFQALITDAAWGHRPCTGGCGIFDLCARTAGRDRRAGCPGTRIRMLGCVLDGTGALVKDALPEARQADAAGIYPHPGDPRRTRVAPGFRGWGRTITDFDTGLWGLDTIKPGVALWRDGRPIAPHISLWSVARGLNIGLHTRVYFEDEDNSADPVLRLIEQVQRRDTLLARKTAPGQYRFDIRLHGDGLPHRMADLAQRPADLPMAARTYGQIHAEALTFALCDTLPRPEAQALVQQLCKAASLSGTSLIALAAFRFPGRDWDAWLSNMALGQAPVEARDFASHVHRIADAPTT